MKQLLIMALLVMVPTLAVAQVIGVVNPLIDTVQGQVVAYIAVTVTSLFFGFLAFIGNKLKIKVAEHFNRETIEKGAKRFANSVVDQIQEALAKGEKPNIGHLVRIGVEYVRTGNADAVRESKLTTARLETIVKAELNQKTTDLLAKALTKAGVEKAVPVIDAVADVIKSRR